MTARTGIVAICLGTFSMALRSPVQNRTGIYLSLLNAAVIAGYTLVDGIGVRRSGAPAAYMLLVFLLTGVPLAAWAIAANRNTESSVPQRGWRDVAKCAVDRSDSYRKLPASQRCRDARVVAFPALPRANTQSPYN